jgi:squalene synthase HpnC
VALAETIREFEIPVDPFANLLTAFRQDQRTVRYETFDELLGYCRRSANPVGHLILYLGRSYDSPRAELSDSICTGLQLANFWQDVAQDFDRGRIYLPQADCRRFGYDSRMFARREVNPALRALLGYEVDRAAAWLERGLPLVDVLPAELRLDVSLFAHGGLAILDQIRRLDYDVWSSRPTVGKLDKMRILAQSWWQLRGRNTGGNAR